MKAAFVGNVGIIEKYAKIIKSTLNYGNEDAITICGILCSDIKDTTKLAIEFNTKAYLSLDMLIREADIIFICYEDSRLRAFIDILKKLHIRSKILCHFNKSYDSYKISIGVTNSYYAITFPYSPSVIKSYNIENMPVIFEGGGKKHNEFKDVIMNAFPRAVFVNKDTKRLTHLAKRILTDYIKVMTGISKRLYQNAGLYDKDLFIKFAISSMESITSNGNSKNIGKVSTSDVSTDMKLLSELDHFDVREFYKNMEMHIADTGIYSPSEKETMIKTLRRKY